MTLQTIYKVTLTDQERTVIDNLCDLIATVYHDHNDRDSLIPDLMKTHSVLNVLRNEGILEKR